MSKPKLTRLETHDPLDVYVMTKDIPSCPSCGTRPKFTGLPHNMLLVECPDDSCRYRCVLEPDEDS